MVHKWTELKLREGKKKKVYISRFCERKQEAWPREQHQSRSQNQKQLPLKA